MGPPRGTFSRGSLHLNGQAFVRQDSFRSIVPALFSRRVLNVRFTLPHPVKGKIAWKRGPRLPLQFANFQFNFNSPLNAFLSFFLPPPSFCYPFHRCCYRSIPTVLSDARIEGRSRWIWNLEITWMRVFLHRALQYSGYSNSKYKLISDWLIFWIILYVLFHQDLNFISK